MGEEDDSNEDCHDDGGDNFDDYCDENYQKQTNTMPFKSKYTPFRHNYLVKKKDQINRAGVDPPPPTGNAHLKKKKLWMSSLNQYPQKKIVHAFTNARIS